MIFKLALLSAKAFSKESHLFNNIETYEYAFFIIYSSVLLLLITILLGLCMHVLLESIMFFLMFFFIRSFAGGYHASTETRCNIISTISILSCVVLLRCSKAYDYSSIILFLSVLSAGSILILCPLDTPEKPLTQEEHKRFRRTSHLILLIISTAIVFSIIFKINFILYPACLSLILESILLIFGKIKEKHLKESNVREQSLRGISPR